MSYQKVLKSGKICKYSRHIMTEVHTTCLYNPTESLITILNQRKNSLPNSLKGSDVGLPWKSLLGATGTTDDIDEDDVDLGFNDCFSSSARLTYLLALNPQNTKSITISRI